jgi:hypothetical protein
MKERRFSSENISFRLQKVHLNQLREEAVQKRISLNTLANQIIDSYNRYSLALNGSGEQTDTHAHTHIYTPACDPVHTTTSINMVP